MNVRKLLLASACVLALSCGPRKGVAPVNPTRAFPAAEVPMMITEPSERMAWLGEHFWDRYTATDSLYYSDSVTVNGVTLEDLEKQVGIFITLLEQGAPEDGARAMEQLYTRMVAFQSAYTQSNLLPELMPPHYFAGPGALCPRGPAVRTEQARNPRGGLHLRGRSRATAHAVRDSG